MKRKNFCDLYGYQDWETSKQDPKKLDIPSQFAAKLTEPRTIEEINAERLYQTKQPEHFMDSFVYGHPVPPLDTIGIGQEKPDPRSAHPVSDQLRLEIHDAGLISSHKNKLNSLDPQQVQFLENLQNWQNKKTTIRTLDENEQYAILRLLHVQMEKTAAEQYIINSMVTETIKMVKAEKWSKSAARACRTLARIRNIQHRTTACLNDFIFAQKHVPSEKRLNSLLYILRDLPTVKAHKVEQRGFVKGFAKETLQETRDVLRRIDKAKRQKLAKASSKSTKAASPKIAKKAVKKAVKKDPTSANTNSAPP